MPLWDALSDEDRAGLSLFAAIHQYYMKFNDDYPQPSRYFNALLAGDMLGQVNRASYLALLRDHLGIPVFLQDGIALRINAALTLRTDGSVISGTVADSETLVPTGKQGCQFSGLAEFYPTGSLFRTRLAAPCIVVIGRRHVVLSDRASDAIIFHPNGAIASGPIDYRSAMSEYQDIGTIYRYFNLEIHGVRVELRRPKFQPGGQLAEAEVYNSNSVDATAAVASVPTKSGLIVVSAGSKVKFDDAEFVAEVTSPPGVVQLELQGQSLIVSQVSVGSEPALKERRFLLHNTAVTLLTVMGTRSFVSGTKLAVDASGRVVQFEDPEGIQRLIVAGDELLFRNVRGEADGAFAGELMVPAHIPLGNQSAYWTEPNWDLQIKQAVVAGYFWLGRQPRATEDTFGKLMTFSDKIPTDGFLEEDVATFVTKGGIEKTFYQGEKLVIAYDKTTSPPQETVVEWGMGSRTYLRIYQREVVFVGSTLEAEYWGEPIRGQLAADAPLQVLDYGPISLPKGAWVVFDSNHLDVAYWVIAEEKFFIVQHKIVAFIDAIAPNPGKIIEGTLAKAVTLKTSDGSATLFPAKTYIKLDGNGLVYESTFPNSQ